MSNIVSQIAAAAVVTLAAEKALKSTRDQAIDERVTALDAQKRLLNRNVTAIVHNASGLLVSALVDGTPITGVHSGLTSTYTYQGYRTVVTRDSSGVIVALTKAAVAS